MAKAQHVTALARSALKCDQDAVISTCRQIIAQEKPESNLRRSLENLLRQPSSSGVMTSGFLPNDIKGLVLEIVPTLPLSDVMLPRSVTEDLTQFIKEREHSHALRSVGLPSPHRVFLSGPPGNGKTTLAGAMAMELDLPFFVLDYQKAISSHLGETGANLAKVFRGLSNIPCVLFVDEMETVLTERNRGSGDVGEMARIVSGLLLEIDRLPDEVVLVGASNHAEMLDKAVLRRFEHYWALPPPDAETIEAWLERLAARYPAVPIIENKAKFLPPECNISFSDLERQVLSWSRKWVVNNA